MLLSAIEDETQIRRSIDSLKEQLVAKAKHYRRTVGWPGGSNKFPVHWLSQHGFWAVFDLDCENRYWCAYGTSDPVPGQPLPITCEINPPKRGINRQCGGALLRGSGSGVFLAHSGKIGGGRAGIGKSRFLDNYDDPAYDVQWSDGEVRSMVVIGEIGRPGFIANLANYIHRVDRFKKHALPAAPTAAIPAPLDFRPEFEGPMRRYQLRSVVDANCEHGRVVNELRERLLSMGVCAWNTRAVDLYVTNARKRVTHLFELKTVCSTSSLYEAVGQLFIHSSRLHPPVRKVLVVPHRPNAVTAAALRSLNVEILGYERRGRSLFFPGLAELF